MTKEERAERLDRLAALDRAVPGGVRRVLDDVAKVEERAELAKDKRELN